MSVHSVVDARWQMGHLNQTHGANLDIIIPYPTSAGNVAIYC